MITGIHKLKTLTGHISWECKCKFNRRECNSNQKWNNDKCRYYCKKHNRCEKDYIWNSARFSCETGKYLAGNTDNSVIMCDEIIDTDVKAKSYNEAKSYDEKT